jgi:hypothetical protein
MCVLGKLHTGESVHRRRPRVGLREKHVLIISKALYGLKSSGLRWSQRFADVLRQISKQKGHLDERHYDHVQCTSTIYL